MIYYDSHSWRTFFHLRGSVLPRAVLFSLPSAVLVLALWLCIDNGLVKGEHLWYIENSAVMKNFTFAMCFFLVFRTNASYNRYWTAATHLKAMQVDWYDACLTSISFVLASSISTLEKVRFKHKLARLFALLHACAMEDLTVNHESHYKCIDLASFSLDVLDPLCGDRGDNSDGMKAEFVLTWIRVLLVEALHDGTIDAPPPIFTQIFLQLGSGLTHFHEALQILDLQFPFPYYQANLVLLIVHGILTPIVIVAKTQYWQTAVGLTVFSVTCMKAIDLIALEIDVPFGHDANDLPMEELHDEYIKDLQMMMNPDVWKIPRLMDGAKLSYEGVLGVFAKQPSGQLQHATSKSLQRHAIAKEEARTEHPHQVSDIDLRMEEDSKPEAVFDWQQFLSELAKELRSQWQEDTAALQKRNEDVEQSCAQVLQKAFEELAAPALFSRI